MALVELVTNLENFYYYQSKGYVGGLGNFSAKTHPYGQDQPGGGSSGQPYIQVPIPQVGPADSFVSLPGKDYLLRGGGDYLSTVSTNLQRISRFIDDPNNPAFGLFLTKQKELYKQQSKLPATIKPELAYDAKNLFINLAGGSTGLHERGKGLSNLPGLNLNSPLEPQLASLALAGRVQGSLFDPVSSYEYQTRYVYNNVQQRPRGEGGGGLFASIGNFIANTNTSRLGLLWSLKINSNTPGGLGLATAQAFNIALLNDQNLFYYPEGPNGPLEFYRRATDTTAWSNDPGGNIQIGSATQVGGNNAYFNVLTNRNLDLYSTQFGFADNPVTTVFDFRSFLAAKQEQSPSSPAFKTLAYTDYARFNRETTYGLNSPGKEGLNRSQPISSYTPLQSDLSFGNTYDEVNYSPIYSSDTPDPILSDKDIIPFHIAVINLDNPTKNNYIHFRAYVNGFKDDYQADWATFKYTGRGENFYTYNGFARSIGFNFTVVATSRIEQKNMYLKLNYLASLLAPNYSSFSGGGNQTFNTGFMRGNIVKITLGDYLVNQPGIIQGFSFDIPDEYSWDIGRDEEGKRTQDTNLSLALPQGIVVSGFKFVPIQTFLPKTLNQEWINGKNPNTSIFDAPFINMGTDNLTKTQGNKFFQQRTATSPAQDAATLATNNASAAEFVANNISTITSAIL
jgi:hypothetical protein